MTNPAPRSGGNTRGRKAGFGSVRKLPSSRIQARFTGPDGITHTAPTTFGTKGDAEAWLAIQRAAITLGKWKPAPQESQTTFAVYAETWLRDRQLKPRTRAHYRQLLDRQLLPHFGTLRPVNITPDAVRDWHARAGTGTPTLRAHSYSLLRAILTTAVQDGLLPANPCHIRGAGNARTVHKIRPASVSELEALVTSMPPRYRVMTLLAAWCGLRFGELTELRRKDVDLTGGVLRVRRAVSRVDGDYVIGAPKSDAGIRDVAIHHTCFRPCVTTFVPTSTVSATHYSSPHQVTHRATLRQRPCTRSSTEHAPRRAVPTYAGTTFATPVQCSPPRPVRPWPNSWGASATQRRRQHFGISTSPEAETLRSRPR